jgi:hypothetical protein
MTPAYADLPLSQNPGRLQTANGLENAERAMHGFINPLKHTTMRLVTTTWIPGRVQAIAKSCLSPVLIVPDFFPRHRWRWEWPGRSWTHGQSGRAEARSRGTS